MATNDNYKGVNDKIQLNKKALRHATTADDIKELLSSPMDRPKMFNRQSSVILANTGERVRRTISFANSSYESFDDNNVTELDPLLPQSDRRTNPRLVGVYLSWKYLHEVYQNDIVRSVLKCSIAYLIASMGVYYTPFDEFLGKTDSKHLVATVAVYFHPSRSKGSMFQTLLFVVISLLFSFSVSFACRFIAGTFFKNGEDEISYSIDLIVSSISLGVIAFMKQRVNKQTFNTACSLASISVVACVVKEGSLNAADIPIERLRSTAQVVVTGCIISVGMCYLLWPVSAVDKLRSNLNDSYNIMSSLLSIIPNRILKGAKFTSRDAEYFNALKKNIAQLNSSFEEAKFELKFKGREQELAIFAEMVNVTISLTRNLQALRSSTEMLWKLLHEENSEEQNNESHSISSLESYEDDILRLSQSTEYLTNINTPTISGDSSNIDYTAINSTQLFDLFVYYLAPSMKSFIFTLKGVLSEIPFENKSSPNNFVNTTNYQNSLRSALELFHDKQTKSFEKIYAQEIFKPPSDFFSKADQEEVTACCGNFSSLLRLFAEDLIEFLQLAEEYEKSRTTPRTWNWLKFWKGNLANDSLIIDENSNLEHSLNEALINFQNHLGSGNTSRVSRSPRAIERWSFSLWKALKVFRRIDVQFGIRVGLGAFFLSLFAYHPLTKHTFNLWRGEWALTIYCIMMNKSLGGTTMTVKWRFIGTFLGAVTAYIIWILTDGNVYALSLTGFLLSIPCFYIIIYWKKNNAFGRFILLTYNLTALYSYSMTQKDTEDGNEGGDEPIIGEIAFHRYVAVSVGIIWALTMASCFLPNSARGRLKNGLAILWLRMGVIWDSDPLDYVYDLSVNSSCLIGLKDQKGINDLLAECETLLKQAPIEFRLKGSFPKATYEKLLKSTSTIIDAFQNMNHMVRVDPRLSANEEYVLKYIAAERSELEDRIFLIFYMIASAMKLNFPLPVKPASMEHARDRMLYKLSEIRSYNATDSELALKNEDYFLLYSYTLVTSSIAEELHKIVDVIKELLGELSEDMFQFV
ncbi:uncharacterized protein AC631_02216 [Debaryomyces fabryi]|uniref:Uncharacterized protein n=1 Tax=Debaryomyces fabryi TaxID=58627 RepID=A0A0V1Q0N5_9ASCO|nr:uncharacterized protein AC631_02216 [Debaryomyces fabryi]KSA02003.1 hypothetical protein AC631_02216 [Debaryomyces fabryi]CUM51303.1 unnamed protein product [Debaryomyces fabryi]